MSPSRERDSGSLLADLAPLEAARPSGPGIWVRRGIVVLVLGSAVFAVAHLLSGEGVSEKSLQLTVERFGLWGPIGFLMIFATLGSLIIPTTVLTVVGATLWGPVVGFGYSLVGAFIAAMLGFSAARTLGRHMVMRYLERRGGRIAALDQRLVTHGFTTAFFMRLLYLPNGLINVVCGVSAIPARVYALATLLGTFPMVFAIAFVTGGARRALLRGDERAFFEPEVVLSILLFAVCIAVPVVNIVRQRRRRRAASDDAPPPTG